MLGGRHLMRQDLEGHKPPFRLADVPPSGFSVASARVALAFGFFSIDECYHPESGDFGPDASRYSDRFSNEVAGQNVAFIAEARANPRSSPCMTNEFGERP